MPQIMIDTAGDSPRVLRFLAKIIVQLAAEVEAEANGTPEQLPAPPVPALIPTPPAAAFAAAGNVTPIRPTAEPPAPPAPPAADTGAIPAPPAPPAAQAADVDATMRDKDGFPWERRIHSDPPKFNKDGTWRVRRGVDEATLSSVRASLRAASAPAGTGAQSVPLPPTQTSVQNIPPPPPSTEAQGQGPSAAEAFAQGGAQASVNLPASATPGSPAGVLPGPASGVTFQQLMQKIMVGIQQHKLTNDEVQAACKAGGADGLQALAAKPNLLDNVNVQIDTLLNRAN